MKKLLVILVLLLNISVAGLFAQSSQVATLNHNGNISVFYGANALFEAYELAVNGDVITLSSGTFAAVGINKNITIRGVGWQFDTETMNMPTIITGDFLIYGENKTINGLTIEGIYNNNNITLRGPIEQVSFAKCRFKRITFENFYSDFKINNATFLHCLITQKIDVSNSTGRFVNSIINAPEGYGSWEYINCYVKFDDSNRLCAEDQQSIHNATFINCIMRQRSRHSLSSSNIAYNCVCPTPCDYEKYRLFHNMPNNTNSYTSCDVLFETYRSDNWEDSDLNDSDSFELTDEAKTIFLGTDKTQVGIYGGNLPYDPIPANLHITKCNVASKSTVDGKLSVDIEVKGME